MRHMLLFDSSCALCTGIAGRIEAAADGMLEARSLADLEIRDLLDANVPNWSSRPTFLELRASGVRAYTGFAMSVALIQYLGVRRAVRVFRAVVAGGAEHSQGGVARRKFFGLIGAGTLALGLGAFPLAANADEEVAGALEGEALLEAESGLLERRDIQEARQRIAADGYSLTEYQLVVIPDLKTDTFLAMFFHGYAGALENRAAAIIYDSSRDYTSVELISGDLATVFADDRIHPEGFEITPLGPVEYIACLASCVGANCGAQAYRCSHLRFMYLVLACMVAVCGSKTNLCHRICVHTW